MKITYMGVTSISQVVKHFTVGKFQNNVYIYLLSAVCSITFTLPFPEKKNTAHPEMRRSRWRIPSFLFVY